MKSSSPFLALAFLFALVASGAEPQSLPDQDLRERYESVLLRNPFQERAFTAVYESYSRVEGVDRWVEKLKPLADGSGEESRSAALLLGQIHDRQFKSGEAIAVLEKAAAQGEDRPQLKVLLGTLYYKSGRDEAAAGLLSAALEGLTDLDQRAAVSRLLGNLHLRQSKRDQAIAVWKRIAEQNPGEVFAQLELADIYQDNRLWDEAIAVYRQIVEQSKDDPYRRCRAWRSIGQCFQQSERFKDAIAAYEEALGMVAPGTWLFEDLKLRLVAVYEDLGDLEGLVKYVQARLEQNAGDLEFRDLLAETFARMSKFEDAEREYRAILQRNPRSAPALDKLIRLYERTDREAEVVASYEKLIELFPSDTDYLKQLGEFHLRRRNPDQAKATWRRVVKTPPTAEQFGTLAGWLESHEFLDEAVTAYQQALERTKNREWIVRLASLKFQQGAEAEAVKAWLGLIDPASSKVEDYADVASLLEGGQRFEEALGVRQAAVERFPQDLDARFAYGRALSRQGKFQAAAAEFDAVVARAGDAEYLRYQAETARLTAWRELGVLAQKQKELEAAVTADAADLTRLRQLAQIYTSEGQRENAIKLYEARTQAEPDNVEHWRALADLYRDSRQFERAIAAYRRLLEKDRNRARTYQKHLLDLNLAADRENDAIAAAEAIASLAPTDPEARLTLAQTYEAYRRMDKAYGEYRAAVRLDPDQPAYWRQFGAALEAGQRWGEAQEVYRKMLDSAKEESTRLAALANLARIHIQQDRLPELITEFQRRIRNAPKKFAAYQELAAIHSESSDPQRAIEVLESGLQSVDEKSEALRALIAATRRSGDLSKLKLYYEQLLETVGQPSAPDLEMLGEVYLRLGERERGMETWRRMAAVAPHDPVAHDRAARQFLESGQTEEGLRLKSKAVELEPENHRRRYEYAWLLAQNQQQGEAIQQLRTILQMGDQAEKEAASKEKPVRKLARGAGLISSYHFSNPSSGFGPRVVAARYWRPTAYSWQGTFQEFRPSVLQTLAMFAQQNMGADAFVDEMKAAAEKAKENADAQRDYFMVLQFYNRPQEALKQAEVVLALAPNDPDFLQQAALVYAQQGQFPKAIELLERVVQQQGRQQQHTFASLVGLYVTTKQFDQARAFTETVIQEKPSDPQPYLTLASILQQEGNATEARDVLLRITSLDPAQAETVRRTLANIARAANRHDEAAGYYRETILAPGLARTTMTQSPPPPNPTVYAPALHRMMPDQNALSGQNQNFMGGHIAAKIIAMRELLAVAKVSAGASNSVEDLEQMALNWSLSQTPDEREAVWVVGRILLGYYLQERDWRKATNLLTAVRRNGCDTPEWFNASLITADLRGEADRLLSLYDEFEKRHPAKSQEIAYARTCAQINHGRFQDAAAAIRDLIRRRVASDKLLPLISAIQWAARERPGGPAPIKANAPVARAPRALARELLEEHLAGISRDPEALSMLAAIEADEGNFDKAIALEEEVWERNGFAGGGGRITSMSLSGGVVRIMRSTGAGGSFPIVVGSGGAFMSTGGFLGAQDSMHNLYRYYSGAGKAEVLLRRFEEALEKQPGSITAHEQLAALHMLSGKPLKAVEVYENLVRKRPNMVQTYRQIAQLYQQSGQNEKAIRVYEDLIKAHPGARQSVQMELRSLYSRLGKEKEAELTERKMIEDARDPRQLANLAMRNPGNTPLQIEIWRKAVRLSPGDAEYQAKLASALAKDWQVDEAMKLFQDWYNNPQSRSIPRLDPTLLREFAGLHHALGQLPALVKRCEEDLRKNPSDSLARALQIQAACLEKRYADAFAGFKSIRELGSDSALWVLFYDFVSTSGLYQEALPLVEGSSDRNSRNFLATLHRAAGNNQKAAELLLLSYEDRASQGLGGYDMRHTAETLERMGMWDEAEQFLLKFRARRGPSLNLGGPDVETYIAARYVGKGRYRTLVEGMLSNAPAADIKLGMAIVDRYAAVGRSAEAKAFAEKLLAADPSNPELIAKCLRLRAAPEDRPRQLELAARLVQSDTNNAGYRRLWGETMIAAGRVREALAELEAWTASKPAHQRWAMLSEIQDLAGRHREARASLLEAAVIADGTQRSEYDVRLGAFNTAHGDPFAEKEALRMSFEERKDNESLGRFFNYLVSQGSTVDAYRFYVRNREHAGFNDLMEAVQSVCLSQSDYTNAADLCWRKARMEGQYFFVTRMAGVTSAFADRGKLAWLAAYLENRVRNETPSNVVFWQAVSGLWDRAGHPEKALAICDQQLAVRPHEPEFWSRRADMLLKLGRTDEALEAFRNPRGICTPAAEGSAKIQLVRALFQLKQADAARREAEALRAWNKGTYVLNQLAQVFVEQADYSRAIEILKGNAGIDMWMLDQIYHDLALCCARSDRLDELKQALAKLSDLPGGDERLAQLERRLLMEQRPEAAALVSAARGGGQAPAPAVDGNGSLSSAELRQKLEDTPGEFVGNEEWIAAVAQSRDGALIAQLEKALAASALQQAQQHYSELLLRLHQGLTNEVRTKLPPLAAASQLTGKQSQRLATIAAELEMTAERIRILQRLAAGGFGLDAMRAAAVELVTIHAAQGEFEAAVRTLAQRLEPRAGAHWGRAQQSLAAAVSPANYDLFRGAVIREIRERPDADAASTLAGLCSQVGQRLGKSETAAALAKEAAASELERTEAAAWDGLLEQWDVALPPPRRVDSPAREEELVETSAWKRTAPDSQLGVIDVAAALSQPAVSGDQVAYVKGTVDSPEDRRVTFGVGSSGYLKLWVNGEVVREKSPNGFCAPDQERLVVPLKKGSNRVLMKVGSATNDWSFCLRVAGSDK